MRRNRYFIHKNINSISQKITQNTTVKNVADEFLRNTSIHGFKYIGQHERNIFEKYHYLFFLNLNIYY